jgi:hypothetical protein
MSSTRKAKDDSVFHQNRYASSPEFERGLVANLVAMRCAALDDKADRELVWFIQYLSHQPGGLKALAATLLEKYPHRLGTPAMVKTGDARNYNAGQVAEIRQEIPRELRSRFPLRGETKTEIQNFSDDKIARLVRRQDRLHELREMAEDASSNLSDSESGYRQATETREREEARKNPASYPAATFRDLCLQAATAGLEDEIKILCLDPGFDLAASAPWYFSALMDVLREHHQQWIVEKSNVVMTALGREVFEALDYTLESASLSLLEGNPRLGKSFAARAWCEQHPGKARFIQVPPGNDDTSFFRDLARGLGLGNFLNYNTVQIRERVESVLRTGDIFLVLDEAQRLWPQRNLRYGYPNRIVWVMAMRDAGVPICMIATPQFIQAQKAIEKAGWYSAQFTGRIGHYVELPTDLEPADLIAVARALLPAAGEPALKALAVYARTSSRYLAAIESISKRASYIAQRNGRPQCTAKDIQTAMQESVIPSDTKLLQALDQVKKTPGRATQPAPAVETPTRATSPAAPARTSFHRRIESPAELVQG